MPGAEAGGFYGPDLAYVHDAGFGDFARDAARGLLPELREAAGRGGLVVELGCGSGILTEALLAAGHEVLAVDVSPDLLAIARARAPAARFVEASAFELELPPCAAVLAVGEVLGYAADPKGSGAGLGELFGRVAVALRPGGLFAFDLAAPGREPEPRRSWREGPGWLVCTDAAESGERELRRRIVVFRDRGGTWCRSEEEHVLRLHPSDEVLAGLTAAGFTAEALDAYSPGGEGLRGLVVYRAWI